MSKKTKEEKLNILHDRLAVIKEKNTKQKEKENIKEESVNAKKYSDKELKTLDTANSLPSKKSNKWVWFWLFSIILIIMCFYIYKNQDIIFAKENKIKEQNNTKINVKLDTTLIEYDLNYVGDNIVILQSFEDRNSAKASVNDLKIRGFKSNYFYLPNKSNSTEELYIVFIGPYESDEEANQWLKNINSSFKVIKL